MMEFFAIWIFKPVMIVLQHIHRFLLLRQPLPRPGIVGVIKITGLRFCEWLADRHHDVLPLLVSDHRAPFDVGEVFGVELDFLPHRRRFPADTAGRE